jgi:hypothetical protein
VSGFTAFAERQRKTLDACPAGKIDGFTVKFKPGDVWAITAVLHINANSSISPAEAADRSLGMGLSISFFCFLECVERT